MSVRWKVQASIGSDRIGSDRHYSGRLRYQDGETRQMVGFVKINTRQMVCCLLGVVRNDGSDKGSLSIGNRSTDYLYGKTNTVSYYKQSGL